MVVPINYFQESIIVPKQALSKVKNQVGAKRKQKRKPKAKSVRKKTDQKNKPKQEEFIKYLQSHAPKKVEIGYDNNPITRKKVDSEADGTTRKDKLLNSIPNYFKMDTKYKVFNLINIFKKKPSIIDIKDNFSIVINGVHYPDTSILEILSWLINDHYTENYFTEDEVIKFVLDGKVPKETGRFAWALQEIINPRKSLKPMISDVRFKQAKLLFQERKRYLEQDQGIITTPPKEKDRRFLEKAMEQKETERKERRRAREFEPDEFKGVKERRRARLFTEGDLAAYQKYLEKFKEEEDIDEDEDEDTLVGENEFEGVEELMGDKDADAATNFLLANAGR